ncbi:hypothetical protein VW29_18930 [Devosia limi DSM 17137]|nr:hypothetical protein VW29_18930 [Devosia limi DSM 17137]
MVLLGVAVTALTACVSTGARSPAPDASGMARSDTYQALADLGARYKSNPRDKNTVINYAAVLRSNGQSQQAVAVLETGVANFPRDVDVSIAYGKALTADGRFDQALSVIDNAIRPDAPDWNALSVKGAILDQLGRNAEARQVYSQALLIAPGEASVEANIGLSYAMTNDLKLAEQHLRRATSLRGANSKIRQNLALVLGLQGRFDESRALYAAELPPEQVEANMAYVRGMLSQPNRWETVGKG